MSDAGRLRVLEQQSDGIDLVIGLPCRWAMGFALEMLPFPAVTGMRPRCMVGRQRRLALVHRPRRAHGDRICA
jgi:hypothetical protein